MDVYQIIKDRILFLEYPPGQLLNEKILTEEFGIKRWALRKALFQLETDKLIKIMPRLGSLVTEVDFQKLRDVYQIRVVIEGLIGRLSAQKISDQQLDEMQKLKESCKKAGNSRQLINIDIDFRKVLNDSAKNPHLAEISDSLYNLTLRVWYLVFDSNHIALEADQAIQEYEETIRVLRKREPQAAEKLRQNVIKNYVARIKAVF